MPEHDPSQTPPSDGPDTEATGETEHPVTQQPDNPTSEPEPPGADEPATPAEPDPAESDPEPDEAAADEAAVETRYETISGGGHRVIRRTVRRSSSEEHVQETITEDFTPSRYQAPPSAHPTPVG